MLNPKIADHHLIRNACIYIRQSTMAQVRFNQESTERQYNLADQAKSLGWTPEQIRILDGDLAQSGELTTKRDDFKTLVSDVAMGQVGAIFSLESSRLARSNKDWHRLLELCAVTKTLVFDGDGCYDPADFNDSLVLGMKGTFAQAELHIIRARLHGAKLNRAQKGELRFPLPVGLVFDGDKIVLDPDQEVQGAVQGGLHAVRAGEQRLRCGSTLPSARTSLSASVIRRCLGWQAYLGSVDPFAGYRRSCQSILRRRLRIWSLSILQKIGPTGEICTQSRPMPEDQWRVVIPDHHPGYITWEQFLTNRRRLAANRTNNEVFAGPAREGLCLLQGLLFCGICGRRLRCAIPAIVVFTRSMSVTGGIARHSPPTHRMSFRQSRLMTRFARVC